MSSASMRRWRNVFVAVLMLLAVVLAVEVTRSDPSPPQRASNRRTEDIELAAPVPAISPVKGLGRLAGVGNAAVTFVTQTPVAAPPAPPEAFTADAQAPSDGANARRSGREYLPPDDGGFVRTGAFASGGGSRPSNDGTHDRSGSIGEGRWASGSAAPGFGGADLPGGGLPGGTRPQSVTASAATGGTGGVFPQTLANTTFNKGGGDASSTNTASGNAPSGNGPSGNSPSGNSPSGNSPSGNSPSGSSPSGNPPPGNSSSVASLGGGSNGGGGSNPTSFTGGGVPPNNDPAGPGGSGPSSPKTDNGGARGSQDSSSGGEDGDGPDQGPGGQDSRLPGPETPSPAPTPEPISWMLMGAGLAGLYKVRRYLK